MAIVSRRPRRRETDPEDAESVITAAAGGLRERFLRKVATITHGDRSSSSDDSSQDEKDLEKGEKLTIVGIVQLFQGQILLGLVLLVIACLVGPGGYSIFRSRHV